MTAQGTHCGCRLSFFRFFVVVPFLCGVLFPPFTSPKKNFPRPGFINVVFFRHSRFFPRTDFAPVPDGRLRVVRCPHRPGVRTFPSLSISPPFPENHDEQVFHLAFERETTNPSVFLPPSFFFRVRRPTSFPQPGLPRGGLTLGRFF